MEVCWGSEGRNKINKSVASSKNYFIIHDINRIFCFFLIKSERDNERKKPIRANTR